MNPVLKVLKEYAKTVATFVATVVINMIVNLINGGTAWPQTTAEWTQYVLTSFGAAIATLLPRNKITQKQLDKDPNVVGGVVVDDKPEREVPDVEAGKPQVVYGPIHTANADELLQQMQPAPRRRRANPWKRK